MTGFASAVDLGDPDPDTNPWGGVHFRTKAPVGARLAAVAAGLCYGNTSAPMAGPAALRASRVVAGIQVGLPLLCHANRVWAHCYVMHTGSAWDSSVSWV